MRGDECGSTGRPIARRRILSAVLTLARLALQILAIFGVGVFIVSALALFIGGILQQILPREGRQTRG